MGKWRRSRCSCSWSPLKHIQILHYNQHSQWKCDFWLKVYNLIFLCTVCAQRDFRWLLWHCWAVHVDWTHECYYSCMTLKHYGIVCSDYIVRACLVVWNKYNFYISLMLIELCWSLCCPNCRELQFIHQLRDRIGAHCSVPHCLVHVGGKRRRRAGVESFILKPFLPHLLVCHCMIPRWLYRSMCWSHDTGSSHLIWRLTFYSM